MNNAAALYFKDQFGQSTDGAAAIASIFGWMNRFARGLGGYFSDKANTKYGMRGRIAIQTILLVCEGALVLIFAQTKSLAVAIVVMVFFSLFVQAAEKRLVLSLMLILHQMDQFRVLLVLEVTLVQLDLDLDSVSFLLNRHL
jgi:nitrate/nitrite transporter NarK